MKNFLKSLHPKDFLIPAIGSLLGAHTIVMFGEEISFKEAIRFPAYHIALWSSFVIAFVLVFVIWLITFLLEKRFPWETSKLPRILWQMCLGILAPAMLAPLLAAIYFYAHDINILNTLYFRLDYIPISLMLLIPNIYFSFLYSGTGNVGTDKTELSQETEHFEGPLFSGTRIKYKQESDNVEMFVPGVHDAGVSIQQREICYIHNDDKANFLCLFDNESPVHLNSSLKDCMLLLEADQFYQVNRWMIVNREAIIEVKSLPSNRLELFLRPGFHHPVIVSQNNKPGFKKWYERS